MEGLGVYPFALPYAGEFRGSSNHPGYCLQKKFMLTIEEFLIASLSTFPLF